MEYFVVYAADKASLIVLRDLLVNGEVKETMEVFGLGISNRDIYGSRSSFVRRVCDQSKMISSSRPGLTGLHPLLADTAPFHSCISQPCMKFDGSTIQTSP